jgi:XTP/dITP diphosphohydrolase
METTRPRLVRSNNPGKLKELAALLAPLGDRSARPRSSLRDVSEAAEPHVTLRRERDRQGPPRKPAFATGLPAFADDSGAVRRRCLAAPPVCCQPRFAGEPKSDASATTPCSSNDLAGDRRPPRARYYCVLVLVRHAEDPQPLIA